MKDADIPAEIQVDLIKAKGYFIYPASFLWMWPPVANSNDSPNTDLANIFKAINPRPTATHPSQTSKACLPTLDTTSNRLGNTVADKTNALRC